jgi:hypothetical protein
LRLLSRDSSLELLDEELPEEELLEELLELDSLFVFFFG